MRTTTLVGAVAVAGGAASARRRWRLADDPTDGAPLVLPDGEERTVVTADGARIAAWDMGDRSQPPIVLAHGWTGDRRVWGAVSRCLVTAGHRVVVYDQRGHGASTVGADGLTMEALADDLRSLLDEIDAHDAVVAGHSMGGMTAQLFAIRHKDVLAERVAALVLVATAASHVSWSDGFTRVTTRLMGSPLVTRGMRSDNIGPFLVRSSHGRRISITALDATRESWLATAPEVRAGFLPAMAALDLTPDLPSIAVPTIVLAGSRDTLLPVARSREIAQLIPGARLTTYRGVGHQLPFETPQLVADVLDGAVGPVRTVTSLRRRRPPPLTPVQTPVDQVAPNQEVTMTITEPITPTTTATPTTTVTDQAAAALKGTTEAQFEAIVRRLSRQSVTKHFEAYTDVDWDNPDFAVATDDPRWQLWESDGLGNSAWYRSQTPERQATIALHRMAAAMRIGWQFENILQRGLLSYVFNLPNGAPEFRYLHHEIIEESQHSLMFQEFVNRTGLPVEGMPKLITFIAEKVVIRLSRSNPSLFFIFVLGGEDPVDHMQRARLRAGAAHPLLERIMRIHVTEEARHISFARNYLKTEVPKLSRLHRARLALRAPILYGIMTRLMVDPPSQLARTYGIPGSVMSAARRDPDHKALIAAAASKPRKLCTDLGLVNRWTAPIWNFMGLTETAGVDRGAESAAA